MTLEHTHWTRTQRNNLAVFICDSGSKGIRLWGSSATQGSSILDERYWQVSEANLRTWILLGVSLEGTLTCWLGRNPSSGGGLWVQSVAEVGVGLCGWDPERSPFRPRQTEGEQAVGEPKGNREEDRSLTGTGAWGNHGAPERQTPKTACTASWRPDVGDSAELEGGESQKAPP